MHWSHLFETDETSPVNIPCNQKQFMIPRPVWMRPLSDCLHENKAFQEQNFSLKIYPHHLLYHIPLPKSQKELLWSSWRSPLIALSLGLTVIRVFFKFLIDRILLRVLIDRVFFFRVHNNRFFSSSMLFFRHVVIFLSNRVTTFFIKNRCFVLHLLWFLKIICLTCFNNFSKTNSEKKWRNT